MNDILPPKTRARDREPTTAEFIALVAGLMATGALAIDAMLPALPAIGATLGVVKHNQRQLVITAYLVGLGVAQIFYGPFSDRFGRKPVLAISLFGYTACSLLAAMGGSFELLLAARLLQGISAAGPRTIVVSIIRDRFEGNGMARIMSIAFIIFMIVPVLAPAMGQAIIAVSSWRAIFIALAGYGLLVLAWAMWRLPETHPVEKRRPLSLGSVGGAFKAILTHRIAIGYTFAVTLVMGGLFAFITSIQQIVFDVFGRPELIGLVFACIAGPMAAVAFLNSRMVMQVGARRLMLIGLRAFVGLAAIHALIAYFAGESFAVFVVMQALVMGCIALISSNLSAMAMQPLGHVAGTAASIQGMITTAGGGLIGFAIGQQFDGTTRPLVTGIAFCGLVALLVVSWANRSAIPQVASRPH